MEEIIQLITKTYGLVGFLILAPFAGMMVVWNENKRLTLALHDSERRGSDKQSEMNDKIVKAQEQRVADAQQISSKLVEIVSEQSALNRETNIALDRIGDMLSSLHYRK
jgi:hypothetical protein